MKTEKIINTATWQGDSEKTKECKETPRQLPPHKHIPNHIELKIKQIDIEKAQ